MHLAALRPTQPAPVWTAVATGKLPYKTTCIGRPVCCSRVGSAAGFASGLLFRAGAGAPRIDRRGGARLRCGACTSDLGAAEWIWHHRRRHRLAAYVSGARRERLSHQRRISPSRSGIGHRVDGRVAAGVFHPRRRMRRVPRASAPPAPLRRSRLRRNRRRARGCAKVR